MHRGENVHPSFSSDLKVCTWSHHEIVCMCMSLISWCLSSDAFVQQCWGTWPCTLWAADSDYWLPVPSQLIPCLSVYLPVLLSVCLEWRPALLHSQRHPHLWLNSPMVQWSTALCSFLFLTRLSEANLSQKYIKPVNLISKNAMVSHLLVLLKKEKKEERNQVNENIKNHWHVPGWSLVPGFFVILCKVVAKMVWKIERKSIQ